MKPRQRDLRIALRLAAVAAEPAAPAPVRSAPRPRARPARVYQGAQFNRLTMDWLARLMAPDEEIKLDFCRLKGRARELARNNPTSRRFLDLKAINVAGPRGIGLRAQNRLTSGDLDKASNKEIEAGFARWGRSRVTVDRRLDWPGVQHLAVKTEATDGEIFFRKFQNFPNEFGFALQPIDGDLIDHEYNLDRGRYGNEVRMGVEIDGLGAPVAYYVNESLRSAYSTPGPKYRVPAEEMIHLYHSERFNQTRGITRFAPVMWALNMLRGYMESELVAARTAAAKMGFFTSKPDSIVGEMPDGTGGEAGADGTGEAAATLLPPTIDASPGSLEYLEPGYEFSAWDPQHPSTAYGDFMKDNKRDVASGLSVGYNALANDAESVNFSSLRSFFLLDRDIWQGDQQWLIGGLIIPVYMGWLPMAMLSGALKLASRDYRRYLVVEGAPRGWPWVDPLKDVQASVLAIANGLDCPQRVLDEQGWDADDILEKLAEWKQMAKDYGVELAPAGGAAPLATVDASNPDDEEKPSTNGKESAHLPCPGP